MPDDFTEVLKRLDSGDQDEADIQALLLAMQQKQVALATGERAVALGGDASDAVIITGDHNVILILRGEKAEQVQKLSRGLTQQNFVQDTVYSTLFPVLQLPQHIYASPAHLCSSM